MNDTFVYDGHGNPFHLAGTRIFRESDGSLTYECPHCGRQRVPAHLVNHMARYAEEHIDRGF
jgi:hypothetical protein